MVRKLRRGDWAIQAQIDLHGLRRDEAREQLAAFLREAHARACAACAWCTARATARPGREPVLKAQGAALAGAEGRGLAFTQARAPEGGAGALVVLLRG